MNAFDETLHIDPERATPENPHYERYRAALSWAAVGLISIVAGLAAELVGAGGAGGGTLLAGASVSYIGLVGIHIELPSLTQEPD